MFAIVDFFSHFTAGVFGGSSIGVKQILSGDVSIVPIPGLNPLTVRPEQRSYESSPWLLPTPQVWGDEPLVFTPSAQYTAKDYETLFDEGHFTHGFERYSLVANLTANLDPPGDLSQ